MSRALLFVGAWALAALIFLVQIVIVGAIVTTIGHFLGVGPMLFLCLVAAICLLGAPQ